MSFFSSVGGITSAYKIYAYKQQNYEISTNYAYSYKGKITDFNVNIDWTTNLAYIMHCSYQLS